MKVLLSEIGKQFRLPANRGDTMFKPDYRNAVNQILPCLCGAKILSMELMIMSKSTKGVRVQLEILDGDFASRVIPCVFPLEGKGAGFFRRFVQAILPSYNDGAVDPNELLNKSIKIAVNPAYKTEGIRSYLKIGVYPFSWISKTPIDMN